MRAPTMHGGKIGSDSPGAPTPLMLHTIRMSRMIAAKGWLVTMMEAVVGPASLIANVAREGGRGPFVSALLSRLGSAMTSASLSRKLPHSPGTTTSAGQFGAESISRLTV